MQRELADIWKENVIEDLKNGSLEFLIVREFLANLKQEFRNGDNKSVKVTESKKIE